MTFEEMVIDGMQGIARHLATSCKKCKGKGVIEVHNLDGRVVNEERCNKCRDVRRIAALRRGEYAQR